MSQFPGVLRGVGIGESYLDHAPNLGHIEESSEWVRKDLTLILTLKQLFRGLCAGQGPGVCPPKFPGGSAPGFSHH